MEKVVVDICLVSNGYNMNKALPTKREREVLILIADEMTTKEIAQQLFISIQTVLTHRKNLHLKLHAKNTAGLMRRAYETGILVIGTNELLINK